MDERIVVIQEWLTLADEKLIAAQALYRLELYHDSISRSYYSMFHAAKAALLSVGINAKTIRLL